MAPTLSIIIPIYNASPYLDDCLHSITSQDYQDIEVLCVDNGSTDNSSAILTQWALKDDRIRIFQQENNGPSAARNKGLNLAKGDFITFVDADDMVTKNIYTGSMSQIQKQNLDVYAFAIKSYPSGNVRKSSFPTKIVMTPLQLFESNNHIQSENALCFSVRYIFRTSIIRDNHIEFNESIHFGEDMLFNVDAVCHSSRIMITDEPFYLYRKNSSSAMSQPFKPKLKDSLVKAYDIKMEQIDKYHIDEKGFYRKDIAEYYIKEFLPLLISNEFHRPIQENLSKAICEIFDLKMIKESFIRVGFKNIYPSFGAYVFYLIQKFRIYPVILYIYKKNYK